MLLRTVLLLIFIVYAGYEMDLANDLIKVTRGYLDLPGLFRLESRAENLSGFGVALFTMSSILTLPLNLESLGVFLAPIPPLEEEKRIGLPSFC